MISALHLARDVLLASAERSAAAEHQGSESTVLAACDGGYLRAATLGDGFAPFVRSQRKRKSFTPLSAALRTEFLRENAVVWSASACTHTPTIPWRSTVPSLERRLRQPLPARRKEGLALVHARRWTPVSAGTTDGPGPHATVINIICSHIYIIPQTFHIRQGHACATDLRIYGFIPLPPPPPGQPVHAHHLIKTSPLWSLWR